MAPVALLVFVAIFTSAYAKNFANCSGGLARANLFHGQFCYYPLGVIKCGPTVEACMKEAEEQCKASSVGGKKFLPLAINSKSEMEYLTKSQIMTEAFDDLTKDRRVLLPLREVQVDPSTVNLEWYDNSDPKFIREQYPMLYPSNDPPKKNLRFIYLIDKKEYAAPKSYDNTKVESAGIICRVRTGDYKRKLGEKKPAIIEEPAPEMTIEEKLNEAYNKGYKYGMMLGKQLACKKCAEEKEYVSGKGGFDHGEEPLRPWWIRSREEGGGGGSGPRKPLRPWWIRSREEGGGGGKPRRPWWPRSSEEDEYSSEEGSDPRKPLRPWWPRSSEEDGSLLIEPGKPGETVVTTHVIPGPGGGKGGRKKVDEVEKKTKVPPKKCRPCPKKPNGGKIGIKQQVTNHWNELGVDPPQKPYTFVEVVKHPPEPTRWIYKREKKVGYRNRYPPMPPPVGGKETIDIYGHKTGLSLD